MSVFITFEGPEGSGKSTQAKQLRDALDDRGYEVILTREPGGTSIGEAVREILLNPVHDSMKPLTELFLYEADRSQHVAEIIKPALAENKIVISDRYADASLVYQGVARDLNLETLKKLNQLATQSLEPDLTFILDVDPEKGLERARLGSDNNGPKGDRLEQESKSFHQKVTEAYRQLAEDEPERCFLFPQSDSIKVIHRRILGHVKDKLEDEK